MATTLVLQLVFALLTLLFGTLSLRIARGWGGADADRRAVAWRITAGYFLVIGVYSVLQASVACVAVWQGEESWLWVQFDAWGGAANVGRSLGGVAFALFLLYGQLRNSPRRPAAAAATPPVVLVLAAAGTLVVGRLSLTGLPGTAAPLAVSAAVMAMILFVALLLALANEGMDELLWLALTGYALKEVLSVSLFSILAWWGLVDVRTSLRTLYWLSLAVTIGMCAAAAWRLHLLRAGRRVPSLMERVRGVRRPVIGWDRIG